MFSEVPKCLSDRLGTGGEHGEESDGGTGRGGVKDGKEGCWRVMIGSRKGGGGERIVTEDGFDRKCYSQVLWSLVLLGGVFFSSSSPVAADLLNNSLSSVTQTKRSAITFYPKKRSLATRSTSKQCHTTESVSAQLADQAQTDMSSATSAHSSTGSETSSQRIPTTTNQKSANQTLNLSSTNRSAPSRSSAQPSRTNSKTKGKCT